MPPLRNLGVGGPRRGLGGPLPAPHPVERRGGEVRQGDGESKEVTLGGQFEDASGARGRKTPPGGFGMGVALIDQHKVRVQFLRQEERLPFASPQLP